MKKFVFTALVSVILLVAIAFKYEADNGPYGERNYPSSAPFAEAEWCEGVRADLAAHNVSTPVLERDEPRGMAGILADLAYQCDKGKTIAALVEGNEDAILAYTKMVEDEHGWTQWALTDTAEGYLSKAAFAMRVEWRETLFFSKWQTGNMNTDEAIGEQLYGTMMLLEQLDKLLGKD